MYKFLYIIIFLLLFSCSNETIYSGKIFNQDNLTDINFKNKENLIKKIGEPSFVDPIEKKFFYFTQKKEKKSIINKNIEYSYIFVFKFNEVDEIIMQNVYDLTNSKDIGFIKKETENTIVQRGLIEKIFGGVGPQQELPTSQ